MTVRNEELKTETKPKLQIEVPISEQQREDSSQSVHYKTDQANQVLETEEQTDALTKGTVGYAN